MPYIIKKVEDGYKVCKRDEPNKCFSNKGIPKKRAVKQMKAIGMSGRGEPAGFFIYMSDNVNYVKDTKTYTRITIHAETTSDMDRFRDIFIKLLKPYNPSKEQIEYINELKYDYNRQPDDLFKGCDWYNMPTFGYNTTMANAPILYIFYKKGTDNSNKFLKDFSEKIEFDIKPSTDSLWYPVRPEALYKYKGKVFITEKVINPKYPVYVISKGRWEKRYTSRYLEWAGIPYKIVVEPQEYEEYAKVIDKSKILVLPKEYLGKNQGSIPVRNFVLHHSKANGDKRHWILDDNIKSYKRLIESDRVIVKSGVVFRVVEDYVDRYTNIMLAGHNYSMFAVSTNLHLRPITRNTRIYSSILINNDIPFEWRGRYNEDTDLSLRVLKAGYPTIMFNAMLADKLMTLTQKGGNTDSIYAVKDALKLKAESLAKQHPDVAEVKERFGRIHHYVNYTSFKDLTPEFKKGIKAKLTDAPNNYGMKAVEGKYDIDTKEKNDDMEGSGTPINKRLYNKIKKEVYKKNPVHSLYRSALIQKIYKSEGGKYKEGDVPDMNIKKWFKQEWISLNDYIRGDIVPCGNSDTKEKFNEYPLCRPKKIAETLTTTEIKKMIKEKNKLKEKPLITEKVLETDEFNIKPTSTGMGRFHIDKFIRQLIDIQFNPDIYLEIAKCVAKREGYNPDKLRLALNDDNKLTYESPEGIRHFGKAGYGDYIIYCFLERNNEVPAGYADMKRNVFRKSHKAMSKKFNLGKYSPNELAINILW